ncbi:MAG: alpha/beta fold hydrolase [Puniceicoccales bacterium]|jgi:haloalkane dehalogenase|nr:alpha/beta fold hydrolase [Puniceicoccales bacterium]
MNNALREFYPFEQHWLELPEGRMHFVDTGGTGDVVLLLHGNPSWSFLWRDLIKELAGKGFRCIAPDHMGMGLSDKPGKFFRLADRIAHVEMLLDKLGISSFHLGVHDWGGAIGFGVAGHRPESVKKLIVTNTAAFRSQNMPKRIAICRVPILGEIIVRGFNGFAWPATFMAVRRKLSDEVKEGFLSPYHGWKSRGAVARFVQDIPLTVSHPSYATLLEVETNLEKLYGKPMFIGWGGLDFCFEDTFFEEWKKRFPAAVVRYHADAGHYVLEDAGEALIPEMVDFLQSA